MATSVTRSFSLTDSTAVSLEGFGFSTAEVAAAMNAYIAPDSLIRYRADGTDPTSSVGLFCPAKNTTQFSADRGGSLPALRLISDSGTVSVTIELDQVR